MELVAHWAHLVRRFTGSLSSRPPTVADDAWALGYLLPGEAALWQRMDNPDRRHAVRVARAVARDGPERAVVAAALLHDCGKVESNLGTFERVGATVWAAAIGRERAGRGDGRVARYVRHEPLGAALLAVAGSDAVTVALVARSPDAPPAALAALAAADDGT
jgi:hypothetical protein